jgi:hypothetical protein
MVDIVSIEQDFEDCKRTRSQLADTCVELRKEIERLRAALDLVQDSADLEAIRQVLKGTT